jgi:hypothetical protein
LSVVFRSVRGSVDLGGTIPVMKAFAEMGALSPGGEHGHLMAIPLYGEPTWDEQGTTSVVAEARDMLDRYGDRLSENAVGILRDLIALAE